MSSPRPSLHDISKALGLDKNIDTGYHDYIPVYTYFFDPIRDHHPLTLFEIGIGVLEKGQMTHCQPFRYRTGNSLRCWREYFPNASIHGMDIDDARMPEANDPDSRIHTYIGDQSDIATLERISQIIRSTDGRSTIDIIIDDGSHLLEHQIISFCTLSPHLSVGGLYIIEDVMPEYQAAYRDLSAFPENVQDTIRSQFTVTYHDRRVDGRGRCREDFMVVFRRQEAS